MEGAVEIILGYARVSTEEQQLDAQIFALESAGAGRIYSEKVSGSKQKRPELDRMIGKLRNGDVVIITKHDRLAKHVLPDIASKVEDVEA